MYPYTNEQGELLYQVVRRPGKNFSQRRPDGNGGFVDNLNGTRKVLYRLDELAAADSGRWVFIPEGEKHVDELIRRGLIATTNSGGADSWKSEYATSLTGRRVALLPDNDAPGRKRVKVAAASLAGVAAEVVVVELPDLDEHGDILNWLAAGHTVKELKALVLAEPPASETSQPDQPGEGTYDDWLEPGPEWRVGADQEQHRALIPGILPLGGLTAIGGSKGIGKTWVLTDLALSIANGVPFLGRYPVEVSGRVLVNQTEGSRRPAVARYDAIARGKGLDPAQAMQGIDFVWRRGLMLDVEAHLAWLREKAPGYVAIIDDTLRDSHGGKENDNDDGAGLARNLRSITNQGPTFTYAHHTSKATADTSKLPILERLRGNTALTGALDGVLLLERHRGATRTTVEVYVRDDKAADPFTFTWPAESVDGATPITLDWQPGEESVSSALELVAPVLRVIEEEPGQSRQHVVDELPNRHDLVVAAIEIALKQGRLELRETGYQDRRGRHRTRQGLYLAPIPHREPENRGLGDGRELETAIPDSTGSGELFEYGMGAGMGENGDSVTSTVRAVGSTPLSLNREGVVPDRQTGGAETAEPCPVCGGSTRIRPLKNSDHPWCDSCNNWADS